MDEILKALVSHGPMGIVAAIALIALWRKDKQVEALYTRLEQRTEKMLDKYHTLGSELNQTLQTLTDALEE